MVIDVEADPEITSDAIADSAAVDPHAVDAIPCRTKVAAHTVRQTLVAQPPLDIDRTIDPLRYRCS